VEIADVDGIGAARARSLVAAGVRTDLDLLSAGATRTGRERLASTTRIREPLLRAWVNHIDLGRLAGVGPDYASLLEAAGVDCCAELAGRDAGALAETMADLVATRATVRRVPEAGEIAGWIEQAKQEARSVEQ
jgi:predicted flap endonuclease-1-like 5' DNA nuclease